MNYCSYCETKATCFRNCVCEKSLKPEPVVTLDRVPDEPQEIVVEATPKRGRPKKASKNG